MPQRCSSATSAEVELLPLTAIMSSPCCAMLCTAPAYSSGSSHAQPCRSTRRATPTATISLASDAGYGATKRSAPRPHSGGKCRRCQSESGHQATERWWSSRTSASKRTLRTGPPSLPMSATTPCGCSRENSTLAHTGGAWRGKATSARSMLGKCAIGAPPCIASGVSSKRCACTAASSSCARRSWVMPASHQMAGHLPTPNIAQQRRFAAATRFGARAARRERAARRRIERARRLAVDDDALAAVGR